MVNLRCYECVDQSFTMTERDMFTDLSNVAQVVESIDMLFIFLSIDITVSNHARMFFTKFDE